MAEKTERPTKTVYLTPDMLDQWKRSGKSIGEIFRAGLAVSTPLEIPDELRKAMGMLGEVMTALANGAVLTWPDAGKDEQEGSQSPVLCDNIEPHVDHVHDGGWCPGIETEDQDVTAQ